jgi:uncharacterized SAM-binding protein YcdF (DUF218 family)
VFVEFSKEFLVPGSTWFLTLVATFCTLALFGSPAWRSRARIILVTVLAWYWVAALPVTADALRSIALSRINRLRDAALDGPADAIVVLGNGSVAYRSPSGSVDVPLPQTASNILEALDQHRKRPTVPMIASGGPTGRVPEAHLIRDALIANGVSGDLVLVEDGSTNTREQAAGVSRLMKSKGMSVCWLVTSSTHMPRAMGAFRAEGIETIPEPAAPPCSAEAPGWLRYLPSSDARFESRDAVYELAASLYYWTRAR